MLAQPKDVNGLEENFKLIFNANHLAVILF